MLWLILPVVTMHPKKEMFVMGVKIKATVVQ